MKDHDAVRATDTQTREFCQRCHCVSPIGFYSPLWEQVAGRHWKDSILCVMCFAQIGDEKHIVWEEGMALYPVSYATNHALREESNG